MGYHGSSFIISIPEAYFGARYDEIKSLKCEIQVRTVLQDAWAISSEYLIYKNESSIPFRLKRDLNNASSLLEIAQGIFDTIRKKIDKYQKEIYKKEEKKDDFLSQEIDFETLLAYTKWKYPDLPVSERWHNRLMSDLNLDKHKNLFDIDKAIENAQMAIDAYKKENPSWFKTGTGHITKALGFTDLEFRKRHPFGKKTIDAFKKFKDLVKTEQGHEH